MRAFSFESFVGSAGGYIGLFLGYAFLQLPDFVISFKNMIRSLFVGKAKIGKGSNGKSANKTSNDITLNEGNDMENKINKLEEEMIIMNRKLCELSKNM